MSQWKIDAAHSEIKFKAKHLVISTVTGHFAKYDATVKTDKDDFSDAQISFEADVNSIVTNNDQRDGHLKSPDFFDVDNYPKLKFVSKSVKKISDSKFELAGDLTIRDVTKEITLDVTYNGRTGGLGNTEVAGFEMTGKLNRFEYGLKWNALTEAGNVVVGETINIEITAELIKQN